MSIPQRHGSETHNTCNMSYVSSRDPLPSTPNISQRKSLVTIFSSSCQAQIQVLLQDILHISLILDDVLTSVNSIFAFPTSTVLNYF